MAASATMPYNTRRKSLSLPSLGIHVPVTHAARAAAANRASPNGSTSKSDKSGSSHQNSHGGHDHRPTPRSSLAPSSASASPSVATPPTVTFADDPRQHPAKKMKRPHDDDEQSPQPRKIRQVTPPAQRKRSSIKLADDTPPPSPKPERVESIELPDADAVPAAPKPIDLSAINDEIVTAVVIQLQNTGNRPHLVKELAAILMLKLKIVQQSANPCAIISSRLATYLKRPCWNASNPCPLAKELETVHPRRTYFYLTTCPHTPLPPSGLVAPTAAPPPPALLQQRSIITPSLSSGTSGSSVDADEEEECDRRRQLSPSPEIDLSSPEFDDFDLDDMSPLPDTPIGSFSSRGSGPLSLSHPHQLAPRPGHSHHHHGHSSNGARGGRGASPPLEKDEKEFTQTANVLQAKRKASGNNMFAMATTDSSTAYNSRDENLFGGHRPFTFAPVTSPTIRPTLDLGLKKDVEAESWAKLDSMLEWDRSPESIELDELDGLLTGF